MATSTWLPADDKQLERYVDAGINPADIARHMGRSYSSTYTRCNRYKSFKSINKGKKKVPAVKTRMCLKCFCKFNSSGPGNRICGGCGPLNQGYVGVVPD